MSRLEQAAQSSSSHGREQQGLLEQAQQDLSAAQVSPYAAVILLCLLVFVVAALPRLVLQQILHEMLGDYEAVQVAYSWLISLDCMSQ